MTRKRVALTLDDLDLLELDLDLRRRGTVAHPSELFGRDLSARLIEIARPRLEVLIIKARVAAEASVVQAMVATDRDQRQRFSDQAQACDALAERLELRVGV